MDLPVIQGPTPETWHILAIFAATIVAFVSIGFGLIKKAPPPAAVGLH